MSIVYEAPCFKCSEDMEKTFLLKDMNKLISPETFFTCDKCSALPKATYNQCHGFCKDIRCTKEKYTDSNFCLFHMVRDKNDILKEIWNLSNNDIELDIITDIIPNLRVDLEDVFYLDLISKLEKLIIKHIK